jgi:hypothetical protein
MLRMSEGQHHHARLFLAGFRYWYATLGAALVNFTQKLSISYLLKTSSECSTTVRFM